HQLSVERSAPVRAGVAGGMRGDGLRRLAGLSPGWHARGAPLGGSAARYGPAAGFVWRLHAGRTAPYAVLLPQPVCVVVLWSVGRDVGIGLARRLARSSPAVCRVTAAIHAPLALRHNRQAAAHHPDP